MKARNLTLSILATIGQFHAKKLNFSAHDVSVSLRNQVEDGSLDVIDVPHNFHSPTRGPISRIEHLVVRQTVRDIFEDGLIPDYAPRNVYKGGTTFVQYQRPDAVGEVERPVNPAANFLGGFSPTFAQLFGLNPAPAPASVPSQVVTTTITPDAELAALIVIYVERKLDKGEQPTLKRIQSRLKRTPATCDEIRTILTNKGYQIEPNVNAPSQDKVIAKY